MPSFSLLPGMKPAGSVVTQPPTLPCSQLSVGRWSRGESYALFLSGPCLGSSWPSTFSCFPVLLACCTFMPFAWDSTVSFLNFFTLKTPSTISNTILRGLIIWTHIGYFWYISAVIMRKLLTIFLWTEIVVKGIVSPKMNPVCKIF